MILVLQSYICIDVQDVHVDVQDMQDICVDV